MKKTMAVVMTLLLLIGLMPAAAMADTLADAVKMYVSADGSDDADGLSEARPLATLQKAAELVNQSEGEKFIIYVMSDLTTNACARFYSKNVTITSWGVRRTVTRGETFATLADTARGWYNPAMIEVQTTNAPASLTVTNLILDDAGRYAGSVFAQAISGDEREDNQIYVQDAMIASNATEKCTITLGDGAELRNFGGMSAVRVTNAAVLKMTAGSVLTDTMSITRVKGPKGSEGPAGAVWTQGGAFYMEKDAKITALNGRAVYADGGRIELDGVISGITGNSAIWNGNSGSALHLRNSAVGVLKENCVIEGNTGGGTAVEVTGGSFEMQEGAVIRDLTNVMGVRATNSDNVIFNGEITGLEGSNAISLNKVKARLDAQGRIHDNECGTAVVYLRDGSELKIYGKINDNKSATGTNCAALYIVTNGGVSQAVLEDGGEICGNVNNGTKYGSAVEVQQGTCSFTMNGGKITGNKGPMGTIQVHKGDARFIMNGGTVTENEAIGSVVAEAGVYLSDTDFPSAELKAGTLQSITVGSKVRSRLEKGNVYLADGFRLLSGKIAMEQGPKTVAPEEPELKLGNASTQSITLLTEESRRMGWTDPIASFWMQKGSAELLTVGGLNPDAALPVYVLVQATDAEGQPLSDAEIKVYEAQKTEEGIVAVVPNGYENGCAIALVQPIANWGQAVITTTRPVLRDVDKTAENKYEVPYTVTYTMSDSLLNMLRQTAAAAAGQEPLGIGRFEFVVELDARLAAQMENGSYLFDFDGAGLLEADRSNIQVVDGKLIVPCELKSGWTTVVKEASSIQMTLKATAEMEEKDFRAGDTLYSTGKIEFMMNDIHGIIPANVCATKMTAATRYTVTYTDGSGEELYFADQVYEELYEGMATPAFNGQKVRKDYVFVGWSPAVTDTVTESVVYTAQWKEDINHNQIPDDEEERYTIIYTDGADGGAFEDQTYSDLLEGLERPDFNGTPKREGYNFKGWSPKLTDLVEGNVTYVAQWESQSSVDTGDSITSILCYSLLLMAGAAGAIILGSRKKRTNE